MIAISTPRSRNILPSLQGEEVLYYSELAPGTEYPQQTYFRHDWIFKQSGTNNQLFAYANGVKEGVFEGCRFEAQLNSDIHVEIVGPGEFVLI